MNIREELLEIMKDYTDGRITEVNPDDVLTSDLGLNSFELFDLVCIIEEKYNISIPDRILPTLITVKDIVCYLEENVKG
ncbi:MAG: acyl carrier protein [Clostridia bacterium]|nr:acyl carrier protein [Clostridia bacterium]